MTRRTRQMQRSLDLSSTTFLLLVFLVIDWHPQSQFFSQCVILGARDINDADKPTPAVETEAVLGMRAKLPCDLSVPERNDKLHMVLWYRQETNQPLYRYDARNRPETEAKRWSRAGDKLFFHTLTTPAFLSIKRVDLEDSGVYRCRVDFMNSPTRNMQVNLTVIIPPERPVIYDSNGQGIGSQIGPLNEGSDLILLCEVAGGRPRPQVTWWVHNEEIDDNWIDRKDGIVVNRLFFSPLRRHHLNAKFTCSAKNTNTTEAITTSAYLSLNLRPLSVTIGTKVSTVISGHTYQLECVSVGSRPPPSISWWNNNRQIQTLPIIPPSEDMNVSRSVLTLVPSVEDNGRIITCRAKNSWIAGSAIEDHWRLNVQYPPQVSLQLGANLSPEDIKEGDDVYFECNVKSNPLFSRMSWFHNGVELRQGVSQHVIISNNRLILQSVRRSTRGNYTCNAVNSRGDSRSNVVNLRVKYVPSCSKNSVGLIGAMIKETITIKCEMSADPSDVQFHWTFNNSGVEVTRVPQSRYSYSGTTSWLNHTINSASLDFGTLACWGSNSIGPGRTGPCYFQVVSAKPPASPHKCQILSRSNRTHHISSDDSVIMVQCQEGFNGGLLQHFIIEVYDTESNSMVLKDTNEIPKFMVKGMQPSVLYDVLVFSANGKGRSAPFIFNRIKLPSSAKYTGGLEGNMTTLSTLGMLVTSGVVVLIVLLICAIFLLIWKRSTFGLGATIDLPCVVNKSCVNNSTSSSKVSRAEDSTTNPDVIPNNGSRAKITGGFRHLMRFSSRKGLSNSEVTSNGETHIVSSSAAEENLFLRDNQSGQITSNNVQVLTSTSFSRESRL